MGGSPPGSAGVPPAQILPQLRPSPPPESTGSGALPLLRPGPCGSRRAGGRLQHRRETERQPKGQHAGGTPALPGGAVPMVRWGVSGRVTSLRTDRRPLGNSRLSASPAPRRAVRIKPECNNQKSTIPSRPWHPVAVNLNALVALRRSSWPLRGSLFFLLFQVSGAPALPGRSSEGETGLFQTSPAPRALPRPDPPKDSFPRTHPVSLEAGNGSHAHAW